MSAIPVGVSPDLSDSSPRSTTTASTAGSSNRSVAADSGAEPQWITRVLLGVMVVAGAVYAMGISQSMVHGFYSPAVYSMSQSWQAFFWGAYDPQASLTLDKIPFAFQIQALSVRLFWWTPAAILGPQVVEAVITIGVLFATVRRWLGGRAALIAAIAFATTPVVAAVSHSEVADMALVCFLTIAAYLWTRAMQSGSTGWLLLSGIAVGIAFQAKMAQAWGVLPALGVTWLLFALGSWQRRLLQVLAAGVVTFAVSVWWIVVVTLTPAANRPYIDGSTTNSAWEMVFGYNLFSRYQEESTTPGSVGTWSYMITPTIASQVGWLYPMAIIGLVAALWMRRKAPRTDLIRAGFVMWALWLLVHAVAFSTGRVAHEFYVVAVAPAVAALAAGGFWLLWKAWLAGRRIGWMLPAAVAVQAVWATYLSQTYPTFVWWVTPIVVVSGVAAFGLLVAGAVKPLWRTTITGVTVALLGLSMLVAPTSWALTTTQEGGSGPHMGPVAGPVGRAGGPGGQGPGGQGPRGQGTDGPGQGRQGPVGQGQNPPNGGPAGPPPNGPGQGPRNGQGPGGAQGPGNRQGPGGAQGGQASDPLITWLEAHDPGTKYLVAVQGQGAGSLIIAGASVLPMGGFTGANGFPSTAQLSDLVSSGQLRYVLLNSGGRGGAPEIDAWVTQHCESVSDAPTTGLYDCRP